MQQATDARTTDDQLKLVASAGPRGIGVEAFGFDPRTATDADIAQLIAAVHDAKLVVLKDQQLTPSEYVELGRRLGTVVRYYEPIYHHPDEPDIFVSSNVLVDGERVGVPKTGQFWHADYQFMPEPFAFTMLFPQALPSGNRCTFFVDMAEAYRALPEELRAAAADREGVHSVRNYFKIRPEDVYRPIGDIVREVDTRTPPVQFRLVTEHPATREPILYLSEGFTIGLDDGAPAGLLDALFEATGQRDDTFEHPLIRRLEYDLGDLAIWDNRALIHRGLHTTTNEPAVSYRLTILDGLPLDGGTRA